ncbi:hypothetical protein BV25DRAFT_1902901 [Artomyces pyxidatus]|uniref:Uncharacterized protein n=1 Tax=Artomyces pyxidatus TaxID=48021 RepID=A0ACB8SLI1_9AGAM|nr:hypothetical protein BV25DRAFT_1902901 [Artomyces pyxidatus]
MDIPYCPAFAVIFAFAALLASGQPIVPDRAKRDCELVIDLTAVRRYGGERQLDRHFRVFSKNADVGIRFEGQPLGHKYEEVDELDNPAISDPGKEGCHAPGDDSIEPHQLSPRQIRVDYWLQASDRRKGGAHTLV